MRRTGVSCLLLLAALLPARESFAQFIQQGAKLIGSGAIGNAFQGRAVAIAADGRTAAVGGTLDSGGAGAVWIWSRNAGIWEQETKLAGSTLANVGTAVAIAGDGNTVIAGGPADNNNAGAAWIWTRSAGVWSAPIKLIGAGAAGNAQQGYSVALSADGTTAIVGGPFDPNGTGGAVWVWTRSGQSWTQQGNKLVGSGGVGSSARQGHSVALSANGNTAIVGGYGDNGAHGAAWIWTRNGSVWTQQGPKLVGLGAVSGVGNAWQGWSVALSSDGNTAIVSANADNSNTGAVWVWTRGGGVWTQQSPKLTPSGNIGSALFGTSVSLSGDGNTAIVGGSGGDGATWVWTRSNGLWTQGDKLQGSGATSGAQQGTSVALSADGNTAIIGGPLDKGFAGAVWIFIRGEATSKRRAVRQ